VGENYGNNLLYIVKYKQYQFILVFKEAKYMKRIAKFEKVSFEQFKKDYLDCFNNENNIESIYENIKLPQRATIGSAGYDFYLPIDVELKPNETIKIPTGIRVSMNQDYVLTLYPRSSLGFKYRLQLNNSVGIIDSDYFFSDNEGHIMAKITNDSNENKTVSLKSGDAFIQGIFLEFGITIDDDVTELRNGGFGSTNK